MDRSAGSVLLLQIYMMGLSVIAVIHWVGLTTHCSDVLSATTQEVFLEVFTPHLQVVVLVLVSLASSTRGVD